MKVLLSIKPEYVSRIVSGEKKFEYRKKIFRKKVEKIVIYSSFPEKRVIGEFEIGNIISDEINSLWNMTSDFSGISEKYFREYFSNNDIGYAIEIKSLLIYDSPQKLSELNIGRAPQSFMYIN